MGFTPPFSGYGSGFPFGMAPRPRLSEEERQRLLEYVHIQEEKIKKLEEEGREKSMKQKLKACSRLKLEEGIDEISQEELDDVYEEIQERGERKEGIQAKKGIDTYDFKETSKYCQEHEELKEVSVVLRYISNLSNDTTKTVEEKKQLYNRIINACQIEPKCESLMV
jgi:hypothetical protein